MDAHDTLASLGMVEKQMGELARALRDKPRVKDVFRDFRVSEEPPAVEWYVDAVLATDDSISFRLAAYWTAPSWTVEADVSRVRRVGTDREIEVPARTVVEADLRSAMLSAASDLSLHVTLANAD
jgi:hypothetical protein